MSHCACCGQPLSTYQQQGLIQPIQIAECINLDCGLYKVTLSTDVLAALTPAQVAAYGAINARVRAREMQRPTDTRLFGEGQEMTQLQAVETHGEASGALATVSMVDLRIGDIYERHGAVYQLVYRNDGAVALHLESCQLVGVALLPLVSVVRVGSVPIPKWVADADCKTLLEIERARSAWQHRIWKARRAGKDLGQQLHSDGDNEGFDPVTVVFEAE